MSSFNMIEIKHNPIAILNTVTTMVQMSMMQPTFESVHRVLRWTKEFIPSEGFGRASGARICKGALESLGMRDQLERVIGEANLTRFDQDVINGMTEFYKVVEEIGLEEIMKLVFIFGMSPQYQHTPYGKFNIVQLTTGQFSCLKKLLTAYYDNLDDVRVDSAMITAKLRYLIKETQKVQFVDTDSIVVLQEVMIQPLDWGTRVPKQTIEFQSLQNVVYMMQGFKLHEVVTKETN